MLDLTGFFFTSSRGILFYLAFMHLFVGVFFPWGITPFTWGNDFGMIISYIHSIEREQVAFCKYAFLQANFAPFFITSNQQRLLCLCENKTLPFR